MKSTILAKATVDTISNKIGNKLMLLTSIIEKMENGNKAMPFEIEQIKSFQENITIILEDFNQLANSGFTNISIKSDKAGICHYISRKSESRP